jgi:magnesium and cobalt exporter, CNNM family
MPTGDGTLVDLIGVLLVLVLVAANGFFVAAEFSLVAVRRSRVAQLVAAERRNAKALERAVVNLDAYLAATPWGRGTFRHLEASFLCTARRHRYRAALLP